MSRESAKELKDLKNLGFSGTNPIHIDDQAMNDLGEQKGYIMFCLEDTELDDASVINVRGNKFTGKTLGRGYYHIGIDKIKLVSGSVLVYTTA